jgi:DNA replication protein DnaC
MATNIPIDDLLRRLHLANTRRIWRDLCQRAEKEQWSYDDFLATLVAEEVAHRKGTRLRRVSVHAKFPFLKTIDDFDFTFQSTVRLALLGSYLSADFVTEGRSLILSGKTGRGKTHLAIAIAYRAIQNGFDAVFTTAAALIDDLSRASRDGRLREALATYTHPAVLVCDEVGYLTYGTDAANVLFHVVNERHLKKRAMIFTTNKTLSAWGRVLHDQDLADTIVDRILERGRLLTLDGPSMRTRHIDLDERSDPEAHTSSSGAVDAQAAAATEPRGAGGASPAQSNPNLAIFSGIAKPDFPEPTTLSARQLPKLSSCLSRGPAEAVPIIAGNVQNC